MVDQTSLDHQTKIVSEINFEANLEQCSLDNNNLESNYQNKAISCTDEDSIYSKSQVTKVSTRIDFEKEEFMKNLNQVVAIENFVNSTSEIEPFFIYDANSIINQHKKWISKLPGFHPHYAVKCNNDPNVLRTLVSLGTSFDCASMEEIRTVLALGLSPEQIIYANPCKAASHLKYAKEQGVLRLTFDNSDELYKIKAIHPMAKLVIRILVDDSKSICAFGVKFGVKIPMVKGLLELAKKLELEVIGVSFHVGSGCTDASAFSDAIKRARIVFDEAKELGFTFTLLDIGGGFPGLSGAQNGIKIEFEEIANEINEAMSVCFTKEEFSNLELIAEPGRYYCAGAFSLVANITSRRLIESQEGNSYMYYINDGVYGSFNCLIFDHAILPYPRFLIKNQMNTMTHQSSEEMNLPLFTSSIWGPTCDSMDCLTKSMKLPELSVGDWLIFDNMGAYTLVAASRFNGMNKPNVFSLDSESPLPCLKPAYLTDIPMERTYNVGESFFT